MKKITAILFIAFAMVLSACAPLGASAAVEPSATPGIISTNYAEALPVPSQLAMGIISLKNTPNAVNASEAAALLPLWKGLFALASTANSSTIEINAVISQIQETMTTEQLQAIAAMKLTQADFAKVVQTAGIGGTNGETRPGGAAGTQGQGAAAGRTGGNAAGGAAGGADRPQGGFGEFVGPGGQGGVVIAGGAAPAGTTGQGTASNATQATIVARQSRTALTGNTAMITIAITYLTQVAGK